ncbi:TPA: hypothetical protein ACKQCJ_000364 [Stenotrophomonas maltophilia]
MALRVASGGAWVNPKNMRYSNSPVKNVFVAVGGVWRNVWSSFSATASGGDFTQNIGNKNTPRTIATAVGASAAPKGGSGNYSYSWSVTGSSGVQSVSLANANASGVTVKAAAILNTRGSVSLQCVVTDNGLGMSVTVTTGISYNYYNTV